MLREDMREEEPKRRLRVVHYHLGVAEVELQDTQTERCVLLITNARHCLLHKREHCGHLNERTLADCESHAAMHQSAVILPQMHPLRETTMWNDHADRRAM